METGLFDFEHEGGSADDDVESIFGDLEPLTDRRDRAGTWGSDGSSSTALSEKFDAAHGGVPIPLSPQWDSSHACEKTGIEALATEIAGGGKHLVIHREMPGAASVMPSMLRALGCPATVIHSTNKVEGDGVARYMASVSVAKEMFHSVMERGDFLVVVEPSVTLLQEDVLQFIKVGNHWGYTVHVLTVEHRDTSLERMWEGKNVPEDSPLRHFVERWTHDERMRDAIAIKAEDHPLYQRHFASTTHVVFED